MADRSRPVPTPGTATLPDEIRVLHVDDDQSFADLTKDFLERADSRITVATETDPDAVLDRVEAFEPHCIVSDYDMPLTDGLELFERLRSDGFEVPFILYTGKGSESLASEAMTVGVTDYIQKGGSDTYDLLANRVVDAVRSRQRKKAVDRAVNHYTALVETAHLPVYLYDEDGVIVYANETAAELWGLDSPSDLTGRSFFDLMPEETFDEIRSRLSSLAANEPVPQTEFEFIDTEGTPRHAKISCSPIPDHEVAVGQTIAHDVMRLQEQQQEMEMLQAHVRTALAEAHAGIWVYDCQEETVSRYGIEQLLGVEELDPGFESFLSHVRPEDRSRLQSNHADVAEHGGSYAVEFRVDADGGEPRWFEDRGTAVTDEAGTVTHVVGMVVDVTEYRRTERRATEQRDRLETLAATLSHDLGNTLQTLHGYLELAEAGEDDAIEEAKGRSTDSWRRRTGSLPRPGPRAGGPTRPRSTWRPWQRTRSAPRRSRRRTWWSPGT